jgi:hypothetical protein
VGKDLLDARQWVAEKGGRVDVHISVEIKVLLVAYVRRGSEHFLHLRE